MEQTNANTYIISFFLFIPHIIFFSTHLTTNSNPPVNTRLPEHRFSRHARQKIRANIQNFHILNGSFNEKICPPTFAHAMGEGHKLVQYDDL